MVHPTAIIHEGVHLGRGSTVGPFCVLGSEDGTPLNIGERAIIRSHTIIYGGSEYGPGLETGHHVLLRAGNSVGINLRIGSYSSLEGFGSVGDYVRIHGRCEMTRGHLDHFSRVYGGTYITDNRRPPSYQNDPCYLSMGCVVTMGCILVAGITIGMGAYVSAGMVVAEDVPAGHLLRRDGTLRKINPDAFWPPRYRADYPDTAQIHLDALDARLRLL